ncbi:MAG TPA: glycosyltransferase family 1 protein [Candidatus Saccharimonadales bacterium]|nr:glycosyltransferase family 1 protein [Candidatus Saccharimonadales bacterium]
MKIAIDARIINSTTGRYVERLINYLEDLKPHHEFLILVRERDKDYYKPKTKNFKIVIADFEDYSFGEQIGFAKLLQKLKPDLVHFCMPQQPLLFTRPAVTTVHDLNLLRITKNDMNPVELATKKLIFRGLLLAVAKRSKQILTPTKFTKNDLVNFSHINPDKVTVTYEGSLEVISEQQEVQELKGKKFIMYLGRAEPYKNNRRLIKAHQKLLQEHPDLHLAIAGKIDELRQADKDWVEQNQYKNVHFLGFVSDSAAAWLYSNCRAYVFASFMEGFGLPALDAMAYGAPVASSSASCLPEVYQDAAHYFNPHSTDDIARAVNDILTNKKLRDTLSKKGILQQKKYSWKKMATETLQVYNKVLEK